MTGPSCETCGAPATGFHRRIVRSEPELDAKGWTYPHYSFDPNDSEYHHHCDEHWPEG